MMPCRGLRGALLALAIVAVAMPMGCDPGGDAPRLSFISGGVARSAVVVPAEGGGARPLIVAFHGLGGSAEGLVAALGDFPRRSGAHLVAPDALPCAPLGGVPCWPAEGDAPVSGELAAFDALVDQAARELPVSPGRVYALGLSNGGGWAVRLLFDRSQSVRGALVLAGYDPARPYARDGADIALPLRPVGPSDARAPAVRRPVTLVHGDGDVTVPAALAVDLRHRLLALGWSPQAVRLEVLRGGGHDAPGLLAPGETLRRWRELAAR